ncbi:MAG: PilX N-terminal domain-containing pilus assembly protein [Betaproteobacteria bacterium]|nr:PilX N-terminal domain-containing pilus assembly protein [Betaproteobacteria bacterium]
MHQSSVQAVLTRLQRGVVLEVAIIILLLIAIVGLAVSRSSFMQDKMSANFYDRQITFQCAQAALRQGENAVDLSAGGVGGFRDCSPISGNNCLPDPFTDSSVMPKLLTPSAFTGTYAGTPAAALLDGQQLQYVVEYLGSFNSAAGGVTSSSFNLMNQCSNYEQCGDSNSTASEFYRITARCGPTGTSGRATTVTLQTVYRR